MKKNSFRIKDIRFVLTEKPVQDSKDVIVAWATDNLTSGDNTWLDLTRAGGSNMGQQLIHIKNNPVYADGIPAGGVAITQAGLLLNARYVFHVETPHKSRFKIAAKNIMYEAFFNIFKNAEIASLKIHSLHFYPIPSILYGENSENELIEIMATSFVNYSLQEPDSSLKTIYIHAPEKYQVKLKKQINNLLYPTIKSKIIHWFDEKLAIKNIITG